MASKLGILRSVFAILLLTEPLLAQGAVVPDTARGAIDPETAPRPEGFAVRTSAAIELDGRLDEAAWAGAPPITDFIQSQPNTGYPATELTEVRVLFDAKNLYVGAVCHESEPDHLTVTSLERDYQTLDSDVFGVALDTFFDRRNAFLFWINPRGAIRDAQAFDDSRTRDDAWDGVVAVSTSVADSGWTVEMAIPWTTLRFRPTQSQQTWGVNFQRRIRRNNEDTYWAPLERREYLHKMSRGGTLRGLEGVRPGRNLTVKPYVRALRAAGDDIVEEERGNDYDAGLDLKYGITSRMTLDLTYRTDFSQVEVDQEQVNLTRFQTFFPETRDFFLENSGMFTFGDVRGLSGEPRTSVSLRDFTLFHSRQIGLRNRSPVPIVAGGRLTGHVGEFQLGLLNVQTGSFEGDPAENFSVVRLRRRVLGNSDIGFMFGNRQATDSGPAQYNRSFGVDANIKLLNNMFVNTYFALSRSSSADNDEAARFSVGWRDRVWDASAMVRHFGEAFEPGIGFVRRVGMRHYYATFGAHPQPRIPHVLSINPYVEGDYITNLNGTLETRTGEVGLGTTFLDGGRLTLAYTNLFERLDEPFPVQSSVVVPVGDYSFGEGSVSYQSSGGRDISGGLRVSGGGYYGGTRSTVAADALWRVNYHLSFELSATHNALSVQDTSFTADLYSARIKYSYSTKLYFRAYVQYNAATEQVITNLRLNFIHAPLSDFFLVYTERRDVSGGGGVLERFVTAKLTKLLAF
ncbi:MAG: hypothetical protein AMS18_10890 [Gemmatimonas sp. SG8_17]|nr:MAG: hypothetical protein AMS18_10890 [Gemmatimonas sp. SG8_17]